MSTDEVAPDCKTNCDGSNVVAEERIALQDHDDGNAEDEVTILEGGKFYHAGGAESCPSVRRIEKGDRKTVSRATAQAKWLAPCRRCTIDDKLEGDDD